MIRYIKNTASVVVILLIMGFLAIFLGRSDYINAAGLKTGGAGSGGFSSGGGSCPDGESNGLSFNPQEACGAAWKLVNKDNIDDVVSGFYYNKGGTPEACIDSDGGQDNSRPCRNVSDPGRDKTGTDTLAGYIFSADQCTEKGQAWVYGLYINGIQARSENGIINLYKYIEQGANENSIAGKQGAKDAYLSVGGDVALWGNFSWFCYNPDPVVTPSIEIRNASRQGTGFVSKDITAYAGETIEWKPKITANDYHSNDIEWETTLTYNGNERQEQTESYETPHLDANGYDEKTTGGYTISSGAKVEDKICRKVSVTEHGKKTAGPLCVTVIPRPWSVQPETKMKVTKDTGTTRQKSQDWSSTSETMYAYPGDKVKWIHQAKIEGGSTDQAVKLSNSPMGIPNNGSHLIQGSGEYTIQKDSSGTFGYNPKGNSNGFTPTIIGINPESEERLTQNDVGLTFCDTLNAIPGDASGSGIQVNSGNHCAEVPYHYPGCDPKVESCGSNDTSQSGISPRTEASVSQIMIDDGKVTFNYFLKNSGPTKSKELTYRPYVFVLKNGSTINDNIKKGPQTYGDFGETACNKRGMESLAQNIKYCATFTTNESNVVIGSGSGKYPDINAEYTMGFSYEFNADSLVSGISLEVGDQICSYVVVDHWNVKNNVDDGRVNASNIDCATIGKSPQINIRGADSYSGGKWASSAANLQEGGFEGGKSTSGTTSPRGSWSQYGLLVDKGTITSFGAAGYTGSNSNACKLYFANSAGSGGCSTQSSAWGNLGSGHVIDLPDGYDIDSEEEAEAQGFSEPILNSSDDNINLYNQSSGKFYIDATNKNLKITGGALQSGARIYLVVNGDITLAPSLGNGRIYPPSSITEIQNIPELTIVADNIYVAPGVTELYGTYIARKAFYSCGNTSTLPLNTDPRFGESGTCSGRTLTINGAVISQETPRLQRTFGGQEDGATGQKITSPSEIFQYTPALYLAPYERIHSNTNYDNWKTTSQKVLPARL
jgi:plastocyanin